MYNIFEIKKKDIQEGKWRWIESSHILMNKVTLADRPPFLPLTKLRQGDQAAAFCFPDLNLLLG